MLGRGRRRVRCTEDFLSHAPCRWATGLGLECVCVRRAGQCGLSLAALLPVTVSAGGRGRSKGRVRAGWVGGGGVGVGGSHPVQAHSE